MRAAQVVLYEMQNEETRRMQESMHVMSHHIVPPMQMYQIRAHTLNKMTHIHMALIPLYGETQLPPTKGHPPN